MRIRTIGALLALLLLSLFVHHIQSLSVTGVTNAVSTNVAEVTVDGVPQTVTVALPTSMLSHVSGVTLTVEASVDHSVAVVSVPGAFGLTTRVVQSTSTDMAVAGVVRTTTVVRADINVDAEVSTVDASGLAKATRGSSRGAITLDLDTPSPLTARSK